MHERIKITKLIALTTLSIVACLATSQVIFAQNQSNKPHLFDSDVPFGNGSSNRAFAANPISKANQLRPARNNEVKNALTYHININKRIAALEVGSTFDFTLPSGEVVEVKIDWKQQQRGNTLLRGSFAEDGAFSATFGNKALYANFSSPEIKFAISGDKNGNHQLVDETSIPRKLNRPSDMLVRPRDTSARKPSPTPSYFAANPSASLEYLQQKRLALGMAANAEPTVLILYSQEFANGFDENAKIAQMINFTNDAFSRSGINIEISLAHAQQINFNNSANIVDILEDVTDAQGVFSGIPALRNQYKADLVAVLTFDTQSNFSGSGVAWLSGDREDLAFSVTQFSLFCCDFIFSHELGHNFGSQHERLSANPSQASACQNGFNVLPSATFRTYACGHGNGTNGTIMSYLEPAPWNYVFSNPSLDCDGEPCGITIGQPLEADNRTAFNESGPLVENFRIDDGSDLDYDLVLNDNDNCPNTQNTDQANLDGDNFGDVCDDDIDGDNINNDVDNCPTISNSNQLNEDNDGFGDACDDDIDGDNIQNDSDNCPLTANNGQENQDNDALGDACDDDIDGDNVLNNADNCPITINAGQEDQDTDDIGDACDDDIDGDNVLNNADNCPLTANPGQEDQDTDDVGDVCDNDVDGDSINNGPDNCPIVSNFNQANLDNDAFGDACDDDIDGDSVLNNVDNCPLINNPLQEDTGGTSAGDACENDFDGDMVLNNQDNCPNDSNPSQDNLDGDLLGDACDDDIDGEGVLNTGDNCPLVGNPLQEDLDLDNIGDACDDDIDGDSVLNTVDNCPLKDNPTQADADSNGVGDACEELLCFPVRATNGNIAMICL
jgi:hypothetical protein